MLKMRDFAMLMDFYESTMANCAILKNHGDTIAYFDMFFRRVPDNGGFAIMAGAGYDATIMKGARVILLG